MAGSRTGAREGRAVKILIRNAELEGRVVDVVVADGTVRTIVPADAADTAAAEMVVEAEYSALIPGLHDHHLHLLALAATRRSFAAGPPLVRTSADLVAAIAGAATSPEGWLRGTGFHESVADIDRWWIDDVVADRPVRIQHRSGARWIVNSRALERIGVAELPTRGVERDSKGRPTGRLTGLDAVLRDRLPSADPEPDLARTSELLASFGVTGVTDATPYAHRGDFEPLVHGTRCGAIRQRLTVMGAPGLDPDELTALGVTVGPAKIVVGDHDLPTLDELTASIGLARASGRCVAVHCVTRLALVLTLAALDEVGVMRGDRIEHGAVVDPDAVAQLAARGLTVVTQPNFIAERGDEYLANVDADDLPHLYPCGRLLDAGVAVAGSTDAPFGDPDPWAAMAAAVQRRSATGHVLGPAERIPGRRALDLFLGRPDSPGGLVRRVEVGAVADLVLLDRPLADVVVDLRATRVRATFIGGQAVFRR